MLRRLGRSLAFRARAAFGRDATRERVAGIAATLRRSPIEIQGIRLDVHSPAVDLRLRGIVARGEFEQAELALVEKHLPMGMNVLELGGGLGLIACAASRRIGHDRRHVVVEANPEMIPLLTRNRDLNGATFLVEHAAYAPGRKEVVLHVGRSFWDASLDRTSGRPFAVRATSLAEICDQHKVERFALIMDIEGAEFDLFERESSILADRCDWFLAEFHAEGERLREAEARIHKAGFRLVEQVGGSRVYAKAASPGA